MKTLREIVKNIRKIKTTIEDFENEVIIAFEDYEYNRVSEIVIEKAIGQSYNYITYINTKNSTEIYISTEKNKKEISVIDVWTNDKEEKLEEDIKRIKNSLYKYFARKNYFRCFFEFGKVKELDFLSCKDEKDCYVFIFKHKKTFDIEYTVIINKDDKEVLVLSN